MDIQSYTSRGRARRRVAWKRLIETVEHTHGEHLWFDAEKVSVDAALLDVPYTTRGEEPRTYWAERHNFALSNEEPSYDYRVYVFDGERIEFVGSHESAVGAVGSAMFLAAV
jgi:hypothetical protein